MKQHDLLSACAGLVKNEPHARPFLKRLLERNQPPAHQLMLQLLATNADPIEVVACAVPGESCVLLACQFATRVLPIWEDRFPGDGRPRTILQLRQRDPAGSNEAEQQALQVQARQVLLEALQRRDLAVEFVAASVLACVTAARPPQSSVWIAAERARHAVGWAVRQSSGEDAGREAVARETAWQEAHLAAHLERLLSPALTSA